MVCPCLVEGFLRKFDTLIRHLKVSVAVTESYNRVFGFLFRTSPYLTVDTKNFRDELDQTIF